MPELDAADMPISRLGSGTIHIPNSKVAQIEMSALNSKVGGSPTATATANVNDNGNDNAANAATGGGDTTKVDPVLSDVTIDDAPV